MENILPPIPAKRYFTIGEVGELCGVKPHVLRYWEQEFTQLRPMKRSGNRRYYQHNEVLMIRRIRDLLYDQGFTISGARNKLQELGHAHRDQKRNGDVLANGTVNGQTNGHLESHLNGHADDDADDAESTRTTAMPAEANAVYKWHAVRQELFAIRELLGASA
jgi:DNA-binding transcriptional MerR regulator